MNIELICDWIIKQKKRTFFAGGSRKYEGSESIEN